jgi:GldM C-terminal domain
MNKLLVLLTLLLSYTTSYTQKFAVAADHMNNLYAGVDNPLTVAVAGHPSAAIYLKTNKGSVGGGSGSYTIRVDSPGAVKITIFVKIKSKYKKIGNAVFAVRHLPDPVLKVGYCGGCEIQKAALAAQLYVRAEIVQFEGYCINYKVTGYRVVIVKKDSLILNKLYQGNLLSGEITAAIASLDKGDIVIFKDATCTGFDQRLINLKPIVFTIKD